ncbi:ATP-binding cassette domain-containing protein [Streptomyces sp. CWNU-52B]|uniref:ATP-binding cassette domain-containing protein n=1 Tax=unclassified Streptomyces TaxID=2593676 RepID=UPI0039C05D3E
MSAPGISLRHARVRHGPSEALHGVSLYAPAPGVTVLLGRNGSGRTTALRALAGTVALTHGAVVWDGADVTRLPAYERARRGLCLVPDRRAVFGSLTVRENLELAAPGRSFGYALDAYPRLGTLLSRRAGTLSGGEQRMLAVSRALLARARVVLADEPTQGMSPAVAARTYEVLSGLGAGVVVAEQRLPPGLRPGTTIVYELRRGAVVFSGEAAETTRAATGAGVPPTSQAVTATAPRPTEGSASCPGSDGPGSCRPAPG